MQMHTWIKGLAVAALLFSAVGCSSNAESERTRGGTNTLQFAPGAQHDDAIGYDNKLYDVDGDGDREHLSGGNMVSNPGTDLRSLQRGNMPAPNGHFVNNVTADRLQTLASSVDGVANSRVIVVGQTAVIGLNLERDVRPPDASKIVQFVRQRVLVQAPIFKRVHITTDRRMVRTIQNIDDELHQGHSLQGFNGDFMELTRRIPAIAPNNTPAAPTPRSNTYY